MTAQFWVARHIFEGSKPKEMWLMAFQKNYYITQKLLCKSSSLIEKGHQYINF